MKYFILDDEHHVVEIADMRRWAAWFETSSNRRVGYTEITPQLNVSTVFLACDHRYNNKGPPILFETMIFGGPDSIDQACWRYSSWDDAVTGHKAAVRRARQAIGQKVLCATG